MTTQTLTKTSGDAAITPQTKTVTIDGNETQYIVGGEGEPLLVVHTSGGPLWTPLLAMLAQGRQVIMPVLPGFGGSPLIETIGDLPALADWLAAFKQAVIGEDAVDLFGGSFGAQVSLYLAARTPGVVRDMVLEAPSGLAVGAAPPPPGKPVLFAYPDKAADLMPSAEIAAGNRAAFQAYGGPVAVDETLLGLLPAIEVPVLVIQGTLDAVTPPEAGRVLAGTLPNCKLTYVYDAGHGVQVDQPERMIKVVRHFLDKGPAFIVADRAYA